MAPEDVQNEWSQALAEILAEVARMRMPFGKFGPAHFPPEGVPVYDLPYEYLRYFERTGYPRGKLGKVLKFIHDIKRDGAEAVFAPLRARAGGPTDLRKPRQRKHL